MAKKMHGDDISASTEEEGIVSNLFYYLNSTNRGAYRLVKGETNDGKDKIHYLAIMQRDQIMYRVFGVLIPISHDLSPIFAIDISVKKTNGTSVRLDQRVMGEIKPKVLSSNDQRYFYSDPTFPISPEIIDKLKGLGYQQSKNDSWYGGRRNERQ